MKCETCREMLLAYLNENLREAEKADVEAHLDQCLDCRKIVEQERRVLTAIDAADSEPMRRFVDTVIERALQEGASDIHYQPGQERDAVRYRSDGVLRDVMIVPAYMNPGFAARIKVMAEMDPAEMRTAQGGSFYTEYQGQRVLHRVTTMPTRWGQHVHIRVAPRDAQMLSLEEIGLSDANREKVNGLLRSPCGIVIVAGPIGAGKVTTLYTLLQQLNTRDRAVATIEDPVLIDMDGIDQTHINRKAGLDFPTAMRAVLRQDPDIIMCGDVSDEATLKVVVQAALTGHLVLIPFHSNHAADVILRLVDMGLDGWLIADSLVGVLEQRLVRRICTDCREAYAPTSAEVAWLYAAGIADVPEQVWKGVGCEACRGTGYRGRVGVHEVLVMDTELREMLYARTDLRAVEQAAEGKVDPMRHDAALKVVAGVTDVAEARRVTGW